MEKTVNPYREEMKNIAYTVAMRSIRKVIRDSDTNDTAKLNIIMAIIHDFEEDLETAENTEERRAIQEDEAQMQREKINEMFEDMTAPLDGLKIRKDGK